jgi:MFS family permease
MLLITLFQKGSTEHKDNSILIALILNGIGYSVFDVGFWVSVTYAVPKKLLGSAYGIITVFGNLSGVFAPLIVAYLQKKDTTPEGVQKFEYSLLFMVGCSLVGIALSFVLYYDDIKNRGGTLDKVYKCDS